MALQIGGRERTEGGMGVRFQCPNGHKLNVKADLAGKRGACPECGVRFIVPAFSGERVAAVSAAAVAGVSGSSIVTNGAAAATTVEHDGSHGSSNGALAPAGEETVWYVRPTAGGQFGPAPTRVFRQWVKEGRVAADSWVWRSGWADWKPGGEALQLAAGERELPRPAPAPVELGLPESMAVAADSFQSEGDIGLTAAAASVDFERDVTDAQRSDHRRRKQRVRNVSVLLGIVAMLMIVVLVLVLAR
jgi:hypothetical protein